MKAMLMLPPDCAAERIIFDIKNTAITLETIRLARRELMFLKFFPVI